MVWGFCVYFVYMIPLETDVLRKHRFQKTLGQFEKLLFYEKYIARTPWLFFMGGENRLYSMHTSLFLYVGNFILFCKLCHYIMQIVI